MSLPLEYEDFYRPAFWLVVLKVGAINFMLSSDNIVAIALACRDLPRHQKLWGMILGAGAAVVLDIVFAGVVSVLMLMPFLKLAGGLALLFVAINLDAPGDPDDNGIEKDAAGNLWRAVRAVAIANVVMSFDNVIAVAAAAKGNLTALAIGFVLSIPLVISGAAMLAVLLNRFPILVLAGAGLLGWIAGDVIVTDPIVQSYVANSFGAATTNQIEVATAFAGALMVALMQWRRWPRAQIIL